MKKHVTNQLTAKFIKPQEYVTKYLPNPDEVCGYGNINLYKRMMLDARITSLINLVKTRALSFPLRLSKGEADQDVFELCQKAGFETEYYDDMDQMLSCLVYGFSVSECLWEYKENRWNLERIEARDPSRFVFDTDFNVLWLHDGQETPLNHPYKWIVMRYGCSIENPYGESLLKACYWPWKFKQAGLEFWLKATEKFSVPSVLALFETQGTEEEIQKRAQSLADMLESLTAGSGAALANVKQVESLQVSGALSDFRTLCEFCDQQISYAITGQSLATGDSAHNTRAASEVHQSMLHQQAKNIAKQLQSALQRTLDWFVQINFGPGVISPRINFDFGEEEKPSLQEMLQVFDRQIPIDMGSFYQDYGIVPPQKEVNFEKEKSQDKK